jgi:sec-independent protein translocase protein TatA
MGPFGGIGPMELIIVLVIALVILGPKKLPGLGKSLGSGMREFKESVSGGRGETTEQRAEIPANQPQPDAQAPAPAHAEATPVGATDAPHVDAPEPARDATT